MRTKALLRKLVFISLPAFVVSLVALEISLRIGGYLYATYRNPQTCNKAGLTNPDTLNILCLGDSYTFGIGSTTENSYPRQLQRLLRENVSGEINAINGGRGGNTSSLLFKNLQDDLNKYHPDIVIIMIGVNNYWNLSSSSFFVLNKDNLDFPEKIDDWLSGSRVYKLMKISWLNFRHMLRKDDRKPTQISIDSASVDLYCIGQDLFDHGEYDLAKDKFKEAIAIDKNNYEAHLCLAKILIMQGELQSAKDELWQAILSIGQLNEDALLVIINQIDRFHNRESEFANLKELIRNKITGSEKKKLIKIIDAHLFILKHSRVLEKVLEFDLENMLRLAKSNNATLILQTYPMQVDSNRIIRKVSNANNTLLVDNESIFNEKGKFVNIKDFFALDSHCNAKGYNLIAENVYNALTHSNLVPLDKKNL